MKTLTSRQQEIIQIAINLIHAQGIQNLTIKNIANKMKVTEPAVYRHFKSKEDILIALLDYFSEIKKKYFMNTKSTEGKPFDRLVDYFDHIMTLFKDQPELAAIIFSEEIFQNNNKLSKKVFNIMLDTNSSIVEIIIEGQKNKEIRTDLDAEYLALFLIGGFRLFIKKWHLSKYSFDLEEKRG